jgi:hypothetical protein
MFVCPSNKKVETELKIEFKREVNFFMVIFLVGFSAGTKIQHLKCYILIKNKVFLKKFLNKKTRFL